MAFAETVPRMCLGAEVASWQRFEWLGRVLGMIGRHEMLRHVFSRYNKRLIFRINRKLLICRDFQSKHWRYLGPDTVS